MNKQRIKYNRTTKAQTEPLHCKNCMLIILGSAILAFGLYEVHSFSGVTEGGVLGMTLLLDQWFDISPALSGAILNMLCYLIGWRTLGKQFLAYSAISTASFSLTYAAIEQTTPLWPELYRYPLLAALLGAIFVGIGVGISVRAGAATGGDDAIAMSLAHTFQWKIQNVYLISDLLVLGLSLSYIPFQRLFFSLLTVVLSGQLIGLVQKTKRLKRSDTSI